MEFNRTVKEIWHMKSNIYIGNRYVPVFADPVEWNSQRDYEPLTIVTNNGASYTSKTYVPAGVQISDTKYWVRTGNYNAQVEHYAEIVEGVSEELDATKDDVSGLQSDIDLMNLGTIICIGDSYLEGYNPTDTVQGWGDHLATLLGKTVGTTLKKYYKGGAGFGNTIDGVNYNTLVNTAYTEISTDADKVGCVLFVGGANEPTSLGNTVDVALANARSKFPNAKILFAYGSCKLQQTTYNRLGVTSGYSKAGVNIPNCYYIGDLSMGLRVAPNMYANDGVHLTNDGYKYLAKLIANAMMGYEISFNKEHRAFDVSFMEYISNSTYVFQVFAPKAYTIEVENHSADGLNLLHTIQHDNYIQRDEDLFYIVDTNGYIKTSDGTFHNASFVLRLYSDRIEVYDYAINEGGTGYVSGTITAFQIKPCLVTLPLSII